MTTFYYLLFLFIIIICIVTFHLFITVFINILNYFLRTYPLTLPVWKPLVTKRWSILPMCAISIIPSSYFN